MNLCCHNLNDKKNSMADIARTLGKKVTNLYILLCALKFGVRS